MTVRDWCPTVWEPMPTGDGLLARIKPPGSALAAAAARAVAEAAARWGNGAIELTARANLQVRGLRREGVAAFAAAIHASGLAHPDPAVERRRNIVVDPLPARPHAAAVAAELERHLAADPTLAALPAKFGFVVDGAGPVPMGVAADIRILLEADHAELRLEGGSRVARVAAGAAAETAIRLAHGLMSFGERRTASVRAAFGDESVFAACGLAAEARPEARAARPAPIGKLAGADAFGFGVAFGTMTAADLAALAELAERCGDGVLRLSPGRAIVVAGAGPDAPAAPPFITDPTDPRLAIAACPGRPGCASATVETRAIAAALTGLGRVHVSGCSKGCAHPGPADITLVGNAGRFDLVRAGCAGDAPLQRGLSAAQALTLLAPPA